jgi:hypothetical protein
LVYNPVTGKGGSIGYGYDNGTKQKNITWKGHDNHLHIGFTDKKVAMAIIDKADSMGLKTTENPYAKKDPNRKVDNVHTGGSLHYQNFEGTPLVGKAVDISGDQTKITELINWINQNYAGVNKSNIPLDNTSGETPLDPLLYDIGKNIGSIFSKNKMTESTSFGNKTKDSYGKIIIPKEYNDKIKSPISGVVKNSKYDSSCQNQITIKIDGDEPKYLQFCGISSPSVKSGQSISNGETLGNTDTDVEVTMYNSSWNRVGITNNSFDNRQSKNVDTGETKKRDRDSGKIYADPLTAIIASLPGKAIDKVFGDKYDKKTGELKQKRWGGVADKNPVDPWLLDLIKKPFV